MPRDLRTFLNDILTASQKINSYLEQVDWSEFQQGGMKVEACLYNLIVIGEAARNIPISVREKYPDVHWRSIAGLRDVLAHEYFRTELQIIWNIVCEAVPELQMQVIEILAKESGS